MSFSSDRIAGYREKLDALDLEPIKFKLMKEEGWTLHQADEVERFYKGYLLVVALQPEHPVVPTKAIDKMWHTHILDTVKYAEDCDKIFGRFIHHFPYLGLRGDEDRNRATTAFEHTKSLFRECMSFDMDSVVVSLGHLTSRWSLCNGHPDCQDNCSNRVVPLVGTRDVRPGRKDALALAGSKLS